LNAQQISHVFLLMFFFYFYNIVPWESKDYKNQYKSKCIIFTQNQILTYMYNVWNYNCIRKVFFTCDLNSRSDKTVSFDIHLTFMLMDVKKKKCMWEVSHIQIFLNVSLLKYIMQRKLCYKALKFVWWILTVILEIKLESQQVLLIMAWLKVLTQGS
jgi:hypothetical protein